MAKDRNLNCYMVMMEVEITQEIPRLAHEGCRNGVGVLKDNVRTWTVIASDSVGGRKW